MHKILTMIGLVLALAAIGSAGDTRVVRSAVLGIKALPYIEAAEVIGATDPENFSRPGYSQTESLKNLLPDDLARMGRVLHRHTLVLLTGC